ncbi:MAG: Zn-ribbon domain-containing OB-fold protein [Acidimicrobiia bacterium]|nr:Zn-ribbon domain-containing OB-fold protein [Acidimicrobiia bacterium]
MATTRVPIAEGVFTWPSEEPRLVGGRCPSCGVVTFPHQAGCPRCGESMEPTELARRGTLWSFTTQGFLPKWPYTGPETDETFEPFTLGYVELPGEVMVESRLTETDPARLRIGMAVELVIVPFRVDEDGREVVTFAFAPVERGEEQP